MKLTFAIYLYLFAAFIGVARAGCGTVVGQNGVYNLEPLTRVNSSYFGSDRTQYYDYFWNFCEAAVGNIPGYCNFSASGSPAMQAVRSTGYCQSIGNLPAKIRVLEEVLGVELSYTANQGDKCFGTTWRVTIIQVHCDPLTEYQFVSAEESEQCVYTIKTRSKHACPVSPPTSTFSASSFSTQGPGSSSGSHGPTFSTSLYVTTSTTGVPPTSTGRFITTTGSNGPNVATTSHASVEATSYRPSSSSAVATSSSTGRFITTTGSNGPNVATSIGSVEATSNRPSSTSAVATWSSSTSSTGRFITTTGSNGPNVGTSFASVGTSTGSVHLLCCQYNNTVVKFTFCLENQCPHYDGYDVESWRVSHCDDCKPRPDPEAKTFFEQGLEEITKAVEAVEKVAKELGLPAPEMLYK